MSEFRGSSEDDIIERIECGESIAGVASEIGCNRSVLWKWLEADEKRSARATRARQIATMAWDDKAETGISQANDAFELSRAKELAHHYRWRASKIDPSRYGDKVENVLSGEVGVRTIERRIIDTAA